MTPVVPRASIIRSSVAAGRQAGTCRAGAAAQSPATGSATRRRRRRLDEWLIRIEHSIKPSMAQNWRNYAKYYVVPYIGERDVQEHRRRRVRRALCEVAH
ncbi:MAG: hypothetical protein QOH87_1162 [Trebonia sp.]|jgi:hypothetical protein|nr:hypothetical protein [Trebonia sp.]